MARKKTSPKVAQARTEIAQRLRSIRVELYGERGGPRFADALGIPQRTWYNYEIGVSVPADTLLKFLGLTSVEPRWLLTGEGPRFRVEVRNESAESSISGVGCLEELFKILRRGELRITWEASPAASHEGRPRMRLGFMPND